MKFEKKIIEAEKRIQLVEDNLDTSMTGYAKIQEELEVLSKEQHDVTLIKSYYVFLNIRILSMNFKSEH